MSEISNPPDYDKTPIAALIRRLAAKGATIETIAMAVEAIEFDREEKQAHRRELERIRQRNHRERTRESRVSRDSVNALSLVSKNIKETKKERATGQICPVDFKPNDGDYKVGEDYGRSRMQVDSKSSEMMEWSQANRNRAVARKSDWHLTLRGFLRRDGKPQTAVTAIGMTPEEYHRKFTNGGGNGETSQVDAVDGRRIESEDRKDKLF